VIKVKDPGKMAVIIIHGIGQQHADFAREFQCRLERRLRKLLKRMGVPPALFPFEFYPVHWAPILEELSDELIQRLHLEKLAWRDLRKFVVSYLGDAIAYQRPAVRREFVYDLIHQRLKAKLREAAQTCGESAPLCIIAHSLGTIIAHEFIKDLQQSGVQHKFCRTPLEQGRTLALYFTTGSPLPIWSLREQGYGTPPAVPSPELRQRFDGSVGGWWNFYSKYDVLSYPLRQINAEYAAVLTRDVHVATGGWLSRWTPLSHSGYWTDSRVIRRMAKEMLNVWSRCADLPASRKR
jgi:hypothetical protein